MSESEVVHENVKYYTVDKVDGVKNAYVICIPYSPQKGGDTDGRGYPPSAHKAVVGAVYALGLGERISVKLSTNKWELMGDMFRGMFGLPISTIIPNTAVCCTKHLDPDTYSQALEILLEVHEEEEDEGSDVQIVVFLKLEFVDDNGVAFEDVGDDQRKSIYFSKSPLTILDFPISLQYYLNCGDLP